MSFVHLATGVYTRSPRLGAKGFVGYVFHCLFDFQCDSLPDLLLPQR